MWGLDKGTPLNFVQCRAYQQGGKLLLLLAAFVTLSLIFSVVGTGGVPGNVPILFAEMEDPPPQPLGGPPVAGPFNGHMTHSKNDGFSPASVWVKDFDAEAQFFNPYPASSGSWNYGFRFGDQGDTFYELSIDSSGKWYSSMGQRTSDAIDTSEGGSNHLKLMMRENIVWVFINNQLAGTLDFKRSVQEGGVSLFASGSLSRETRVERFTVWAEAKIVPMSSPPLAGPFNRPLAYDKDSIGVYLANVQVLNFDAEAQFFNPYPTSTGSWNYGFRFRDLGNTFYELSIDSKGQWHHYLRSDGEDTPLGQGKSNAIDTSEGGSNHLKLMVRRHTVWVYINNQLAATLDLSAFRERVRSGDVSVFASGSLSRETRVERFTVWGLEIGDIKSG